MEMDARIAMWYFLSHSVRSSDLLALWMVVLLHYCSRTIGIVAFAHVLHSLLHIP